MGDEVRGAFLQAALDSVIIETRILSDFCNYRGEVGCDAAEVPDIGHSLHLPTPNLDYVTVYLLI